MKRTLLLLLALAALPSLALAQKNCPTCTIGLWDDLGMTARTGTITTGVPKFIYMGVQFGESYTGVTGLEFSILGMDGLLVLAKDPLTPATVVLGDPPAPADTTSGTGGMNIAWPACLGGGSQIFVRFQVLALAPIANRCLQVWHKFPPGNPTVPFPLFTDCDIPAYTLISTRGGAYSLNVSGSIACPTAAAPSTWSHVKELFR